MLFVYLFIYTMLEKLAFFYFAQKYNSTDCDQEQGQSLGQNSNAFIKRKGFWTFDPANSVSEWEIIIFLAQ